MPPATDPAVLCIGDVMVDIVAELPGPLALGSDVHAPIRYVAGGSAGNTAAWLAAVGMSVTLVGRVGDDAMGEHAHRDLAAAGITDRLQTDPARPTGTCIVLVSPGGERTMVPDPGANATLAPGDLEASDFNAGGRLHVSGYALLGGARPAALAALTAARAAGMTVSVDASSAAPLALAGGERFLGWIGTGLLLFANAAEAEVLTGRSDPADSVALLAGRVGTAVVKAGAGGAYWSDGPGQVVHAPAQPVAAVDTTGAGDAFAAGFLRALSRGIEAAHALREANQLAAIACRQIGGRPPRELVSFTPDHRN